MEIQFSCIPLSFVRNSSDKVKQMLSFVECDSRKLSYISNKNHLQIQMKEMQKLKINVISEANIERFSILFPNIRKIKISRTISLHRIAWKPGV